MAFHGVEGRPLLYNTGCPQTIMVTSTTDLWKSMFQRTTDGYTTHRMQRKHHLEEETQQSRNN